MLVLGNDDSQTIRPGEALAFGSEVIARGKSCLHRKNGCMVSIHRPGTYEVMFRAIVSGNAGTVAAMVIEAGGDTLPETRMQTAFASLSDERGIASATAIRNGIGRSVSVCVRNVGDCEVDVSAPCLMVRRI